MSRNWARALSAALAVGVALLAAPAAHAGAGYFTSQDLTGSAGVPVGQMEPAGWYTPWDLKRHFAYVSDDQRIIVASSAPGGSWTWTTALDSAYVLGYLTTYSYSWDHSSHIVYADGVTHHLIELWSSDASPTWQKVDLTETYHGPLIELDPRGYEQDGQQHVVFKDGHGNGVIWEATFAPGAGWGFTNLTERAGIHPKNDYGWYLAASSLGTDGEAIGYIGTDGYPHVLAGQHGRWTDQRVGVPADEKFFTMNSMVFLRDGRLVRYALRYYTSDTHLHEVAWEGGRWTDTDVAAATPTVDPRWAPNAANDSYLWNADGSEHMFTTGADGAVREYVRTRAGDWYVWRDSEPIPDGLGWIGAFAAPDDTMHGTETEFYVYYNTDKHVVVADLTAAYQA
ncbi:hypothetical protein [Kutzneria kofuensis]|uniref:BNR repeat neuraminidase n=1 Tax=Kutzneria kofuensis TaxID=103725 RepID=A0A7W9KCM0_9PSEU|nr:hypothetical protein [Kutzneria kofuensis]MBB5889354.1 hypothetical protein [Kutzneria kofuensis]